ncbi:hypothetical protein HYW84_01810 [Candidatus Peregrinibacteria bacterium]|nr:hypothetical protein [Candidatus Peregrinibacteria bacterium]
MELKVLIAHDEPAQAEFLQELVEKSICVKALCAACKEEALALIAQHPGLSIAISHLSLTAFGRDTEGLLVLAALTQKQDSYRILLCPDGFSGGKVYDARIDWKPASSRVRIPGTWDAGDTPPENGGVDRKKNAATVDDKIAYPIARLSSLLKEARARKLWRRVYADRAVINS